MKFDDPKIEPYYKNNTKIAFIALKSNLSYILLLIYLFYFQTNIAQELENKRIPDQSIPEKKDINTAKINRKKDSLLNKKKDSISTDSIKKPKEVIDFIVTHDAEDYTVQNTKNKTVTLYNKGHLIYGDIDLKAGKIVVDYKNNTVYAKGIKDSTGTKYVQRPVFKQGDQESVQDSILFNFKSKKALVYGVKSIQGEMITYGEKTKRINDSTVYMRKLRFTTSKKKIPDYYIATNKAKLVPGKKIIVGGSQLVLADVPTPLYLPFAYFPLTSKRTSGFIIPTWGESSQQGFFLQNGGYYFAISDYFDLEVLGDIYTNGSWALSTNSAYYVRYKYSGNFSFRYQDLITSIRGFNDYSKTVIYNISWSHNQDSKLNPNSQLSAYVNLGSSRYYQDSYNERDQSQYLTNTLNSSINYYKKFVGTPFSMNLGLSHNQNSNTKSIDMTLPSLTVNMESLYPFVGKGGVKKNTIQKIGINYSMNGAYKINTTDEDFFTSKMFKGAKSGIQHNLRANTNMKVLKYFTLSPNISYSDVWYFDKIRKHYDPYYVNQDKDKTLGKVINDTISGFNRFNKYSGGVSLSTNIYGMFKFKKGRLKAIRHTFRPSVSWSYTPNLAKNHELTVQKSANPNDLMTYSAFEGGMYGGPPSRISNSIGISLNNVLEAKVAPKDPDSDEEDKKIMLLNNLNFNTSYNFAADSLRWSTVSFDAGTSLLKNKMSVNLKGSLDPYQITSKGVRINKFNKGLFRLTSARLSANYSISSKELGKKDDPQKKDSNPPPPPDVYTAKMNPTNEFANRASQKTKKDTKKKTKLYHAVVPWNISFVYAANYTNNGYSIDEIVNHTIGFNGSIEPSPKWKIGFNSGYDIKNGAFSYTTLNFSRDLDSWRFNFNWTPFGDRTSYYFFIGVKSSMLSDLKWDKNKPPDKRLF